MIMRILLVGNQIIAYNDLQEQLKANNLPGEVIACSSLLSALEIASNCAIDILVAHLALFAGEEETRLLGRFKQAGARLYILAVAHPDNYAILNPTLEKIIDDYISAPFTGQEISVRLRKALHKAPQDGLRPLPGKAEAISRGPGQAADAGSQKFSEPASVSNSGAGEKLFTAPLSGQETDKQLKNSLYSLGLEDNLAAVSRSDGSSQLKPVDRSGAGFKPAGRMEELLPPPWPGAGTHSGLESKAGGGASQDKPVYEAKVNLVQPLMTPPGKIEAISSSRSFRPAGEQQASPLQPEQEPLFWSGAVVYGARENKPGSDTFYAQNRPAYETKVNPAQPLATPPKTGAAADGLNFFQSGSLTAAEPETPVLQTGKKNPFFGVARLMGNILTGALFTIMLVMAFFLVQGRLANAFPSIAGYQMYVVLSGSMSPAFDTGSLAFVREADPASIAPGDIITFRGYGGGTPTTHRVVELLNDDGLKFITRGDANSVNDPLPVPAENLIGKVHGSVPYFGYLIGFAQTRNGLLALVVIPGLLVVIFEARNLSKYMAENRKRKKEERRRRRTNSGIRGAAR